MTLRLRIRLPGPSRFFEELSGSMIRARLYAFSRRRRPVDPALRSGYEAWLYGEALR